MRIAQLLWTGGGLFSLFLLVVLARALCSHFLKSWRLSNKVLMIMSYAFLWYTISICFTLFNKWLFTEFDGGRGVPFPVLLTACHVALKGLLATASLAVCKRKSPCAAWRSLSWKRYLTKAAPVGVFTSLDIAMSNAAFLFISVSFYTVIKTSSIISVLILSMVLCLQRCSLLIVVIIVVVASGLMLASMGELHFRIEGFLLVLGAGIAGSLRWVITQMMVSSARVAVVDQCGCCASCCTAIGWGTCCRRADDEAEAAEERGGGIALARRSSSAGAREAEGEAASDSAQLGAAALAVAVAALPSDRAGAAAARPSAGSVDSVGAAGEAGDGEGGRGIAGVSAVETVMFISPSAVIALIPYGLCIELPALVNAGISTDALYYLPVMIALGGVLAFLLLLVETQLVQITSSLTLSVIGNLKDCLQITIVVVVFGEEIAPLNVVGLVLALGGIGAYNVAKQMEMCRAEKKERAAALGFGQLGSGGGEEEEEEDDDEIVIDFTKAAIRLDEEITAAGDVVNAKGRMRLSLFRTRRLSFTPQASVTGGGGDAV